MKKIILIFLCVILFFSSCQNSEKDANDLENPYTVINEYPENIADEAYLTFGLGQPQYEGYSANGGNFFLYDGKTMYSAHGGNIYICDSKNPLLYPLENCIYSAKDVYAPSLNLYDGKLYFCVISENSGWSLVMLDIASQKAEVIHTGDADYAVIKIADGKILFSEKYFVKEYRFTLMEIQLDGSGLKELFEADSIAFNNEFFIVDGKHVAVLADRAIYISDINELDFVKIVEDIDSSFLYMADNSIFFSNANVEKINRIDIATGAVTEITLPDKYSALIVTNDRIFFKTPSDMGMGQQVLYCCDFDGNKLWGFSKGGVIEQYAIFENFILVWSTVKTMWFTILKY